MAQYRNIPGVNMDVKDGQLMLGQDNTTESLLIIGVVNAPANINVPEEPILVRNEGDLKENFGGYFYKGKVNPIAAEWAAAFRYGARNVYLMAIKGDTPKAQYIYLQDMLFNTITDLGIEQVVLTGLYADEDIHGITAADFGKEDLHSIEGIEALHVFRALENATALVAPADLTVHYRDREVTVSLESATVPNLVQELNLELRRGIAEIGLDISVEVELIDGKAVLKASDEIQLEGAEVLAALKLEGVEPSLEGFGNPAALLAAYADGQANEAGDILCYIGTKPVLSTSLSEIRERVNHLLARKNEIHRLVQVVAGPEVGLTLPGSLRTQWVSGVTQYALLVQGLPAQVAPTNQVLPQASALRYNLSLRQLDNLSGHKYVTFRIKNNAITVVDGVTTAPDLFVGQDIVHSDFTRLSTVRTINYIKRRMRTMLDAFIGQPNDFEVYNAMRTTIKAEIRDAISNAIIQDASFEIVLGDTLDTAVVNLTILPQFELRHIQVSIGLTTPDNFEAE